MADLTTRLFGHILPNPVMPAAGPNCRDGEALVQAAKGGAGALVMKTVSVHPAPVPYPNIAAAGNRSLLNAELWSEIPVEQYIEQEYAIAKSTGLMLIAGVGYTAEELAELGPRIAATGCVDAFEFSIHYLGSDRTPVIEAAKALHHSVELPILAKMSPGFPDIPGLVQDLEPYVDGFIAMNSLGPVLDFDPVTRQPYLGSEHGYGWLSGKTVFPLALRLVREIALHTDKPILGVGGISSGVDAIKMLMVGARAVQVCSAAIESGHGIYGKIAAEMDLWLDRNGIRAVEDIIGLYNLETHPKRDIPLNYAVNKDVCMKCGRCLRSCIHTAIIAGPDGYPRHTERCIHCGYCATICPVWAIHGALPDKV